MSIDSQIDFEISGASGATSAFTPRKFRQTYNVRIAIAALIFCVMYIIWEASVRSESARLTFIWITVGVVLLYGALFLAFEETVVTTSQQGIRRDSIFGSTAIAWNEISETRYLVSPVRPRIAIGMFGILITMLRRRPRVRLRLTIFSNEGKRIKINSSVHQAREAIGIVLGQTVPRMVDDATARIQRGETVNFGPISLSLSGIAWKSQFPVAISEISRAEIVGRQLRIKTSQGWRSFIRVRTDRVPNVLVMLDILESIAPRLKPPRIDPLARVRL